MDTHTPPSPSPSPCTVKRLCRFTLSNPKSRFLEYPLPVITQNFTQELEPMTNDEYTEFNHEDFRKGQPQKKNKKMLLAEWIIFIALSTAFVCSLALPALNNSNSLICGLNLWRWSLMILSIISGRLVSGWFITLLVFILERSCTLCGKVLYFVYGLRRMIHYFVWLGFVLLTWTLVFNADLRQSNKVLNKVFQALVASLIGFTIWLLKIVVVKALTLSFYINNYFDRMKESAFHHYVMETLSTGDAVSDETHQRKKIEIQELKLSHTKASVWTIKKLETYVKSFGLTKAKAVENSKIASEAEARICAKSVFKKVAKADAKYIEEEDLMRFLKRSEIHAILFVFEGALETGKITKSAFKDWVARALYEHKSLIYSLNDIKRVVRDLHKLASVIVSMIILAESLSFMNVVSNEMMVLPLAQLLLLVFTFQNVCKIFIESIVFVFITHPFDIGDHCMIDGVQMIVEEMNMLNTVFLKLDNEKVYYPNSELMTKPISNFCRSPEIQDVIEFDLDSSTSKDTIEALEKSIRTYILSKPKHWNPKHSVIAKGIEDVNVLKMALCVQHKINHQYDEDRCTRISDLKKMFKDLNIYHHRVVHVM